MEVWREIPSFPGYSVSTLGRVRNDVRERMLAPHKNQYDILYVSLNHKGVQQKRSVAVLVTQTFIEPPTLEAFDTPINLDGDRNNNKLENLTLRPRWFAVRYFRQFKSAPTGLRRPIRDIKTGELFETSWDAAIKYGLLDRDILIAVLNETYVWPTFQKFEVIHKQILTRAFTMPYNRTGRPTLSASPLILCEGSESC